MTPQEIAKKYVYGNHDAITQRQEEKDMIKDIEECVQAKIKEVFHKPSYAETNGQMMQVHANRPQIECGKCGYVDLPRQENDFRRIFDGSMELMQTDHCKKCNCVVRSCRIVFENENKYLERRNFLQTNNIPFKDENLISKKRRNEK